MGPGSIEIRGFLKILYQLWSIKSVLIRIQTTQGFTDVLRKIWFVVLSLQIEKKEG